MAAFRLGRYLINNSLHERLESIQHNSALAKASAIEGSSRGKLYQKLGLESVQQR